MTTVLPLRSTGVRLCGPDEMVVDLLQAQPGGLDGLLERPVEREVGEGVAHHPAGDLAVTVAAHAVGDRPQALLRAARRTRPRCCPAPGRCRDAAAERKFTGPASSTSRVPGSVSSETTPGTDRQRWFAHEPSSSAG